MRGLGWNWGKCCRSSSCCCGPGWGRNLKSKLPTKRLVKIYIAVFVNMLSSAFSITMVFPYLPFMMEFLIPRLREDHQSVGKYVGVVGGSLFFGRLLGSYMWGVLADKKGRKPVLLISNVCVAIATIAFGFSVNFGMAVATRALVGFFNGMITASKAIMSEVTDDKTQALGITILGSSWGLGYILGPAVSGAVADPIGQYDLNITNSFIHGLLTRFPYCLPSFASVILSVSGLFLAIFMLPETLGTKKNRRRSEINQDTIKMIRLQSSTDKEDMNAEDQQTTNFCEEEEEEGESDETSLLKRADMEARTDCIISNPVAADIGTNSGVKSAGEESSGESGLGSVCRVAEDEETEMRIGEEEARNGEEEQTSERDGEEGLGEGWKREEKKRGEEGGVSRRKFSNKHLSSLFMTLRSSWQDIKLFFRTSSTRTALFVYSVYSFGLIGFAEIYPLWAFTQPHYGGLGFSLQQIGISMTISGVFNLPMSLFAFPLLEKRFKAIMTFYILIIPQVFLVQILPNIHYLISTNHSWLLWGLLVTVILLINGFGSMGLSSIFLFINNSVTFDKLGSVNGIAMTMTSASRAVAPVVMGALYSLSLSDTTSALGYPVDYHLVFIIASLCFLISVLMVACLPRSINHQKIIEDV